MDVIQRIKDLLAENNISGAKMSRDLGFSNAVFSQWNTGKQVPSTKYIQKIADYFGVSVDYLIGKTDKKDNSDAERTKIDLSPKQQELLELMNALPDDLQEKVFDLLRTLIESVSKDQTKP